MDGLPAVVGQEKRVAVELQLVAVVPVRNVVIGAAEDAVGVHDDFLRQRIVGQFCFRGVQAVLNPVAHIRRGRDGIAHLLFERRIGGGQGTGCADDRLKV